jgi:dolichol-phosphate mannosyltransferase
VSGTWLILPTFEEADNIEPMVHTALEQLRSTGREHRILVVDDASPDGTGQIADRLAAELDEVQVLHRPGKGGLGPAYLAGFEVALAGGAELVL